MEVYRDMKTMLASHCSILGADVWQDKLLIGLPLNPIAHRLLSLPRIIPTASIAKACHLAAILLVMSIKHKYNNFPCPLPPHSITIANALRNHKATGPEFLELRLWLLTATGVTAGTANERQICLRYV